MRMDSFGSFMPFCAMAELAPEPAGASETLPTSLLPLSRAWWPLPSEREATGDGGISGGAGEAREDGSRAEPTEDGETIGVASPGVASVPAAGTGVAALVVGM